MHSAWFRAKTAREVGMAREVGSHDSLLRFLWSESQSILVHAYPLPIQYTRTTFIRSLLSNFWTVYTRLPKLWRVPRVLLTMRVPVRRSAESPYRGTMACLTRRYGLGLVLPVLASPSHVRAGVFQDGNGEL